MLEAVKKQFCIQWDALVLGIFVTLCGSLFGMILFYLVAHFDKDVTTYFQLGALIGMLFSGMYSILMVTAQMQFYFNLEVSMGCIRKHFFFSFFLLSFLENLVSVVLLIAIAYGENALYAAWYPALEKEYDFIPLLQKAGVLAALAIPMVAGLCGALILRYGRKARWTFWGVWMIGCIGIPRIIEAAIHAPNSLFGILGNSIIKMVRAVPANVWIGAVSVFCLACFAVSFLFIRKQAVTV